MTRPSAAIDFWRWLTKSSSPLPQDPLTAEEPEPQDQIQGVWVKMERARRANRSEPPSQRRLIYTSVIFFTVFQTIFTVFVKITGDIYGSDYALFDTQLMNIVYFLLCLPVWFLTLSMKVPCVKNAMPTSLHWLELRRYPSVGNLAKEQGWILVTSILDATAALLYGIGGNGSSGPFQSVVTNIAPFLLQLLIYPFYRRQREARRFFMQDKRWLATSVGSVIGLAITMFSTTYVPNNTAYPIDGLGYPCSVGSFVVAALCTTMSWHIKEFLFVTYQTDAIHLNTWNGFHMVWMTFPMFVVQTAVPPSWTSCTTTGTIAENMEIGWRCMRQRLNAVQVSQDGFSYGCASAGWTEWIYAISTWLAGMGQFAFTRFVKSSVVQFAYCILTAAVSTGIYWIFHGFGIHSAVYWYNIIGLIGVIWFTVLFSACERDVIDYQALQEAEDGDQTGDAESAPEESRTVGLVAESSALLLHHH